VWSYSKSEEAYCEVPIVRDGAAWNKHLFYKNIFLETEVIESSDHLNEAD
jgi:hypothetical protein